MIQAAKRDRDLQADLLCLCARDVVLWVNDWCWTYDPRQPQPMLPFNTFDRQNDYLRWREDRIAARERGIAEKSRDMGVTWLNVASQVHQWLFVPGHKGTFGSRKQDLVDQLGQPDSIFEKARIILRNLPAWQMPTGFDWKKHDNFMRLMNPETDAALTGEAGKNMGRGGRSRVYDVDEAAHLEHPESVEAAISQNADTIIETSTPHGAANPFAQRRHSGKIKVFTFHWRDDPRKGPAWYQRQVDTLDPIVVAQEIDINYDASLEGVIIPKGWMHDAGDRPLYENERGAIVIGGDIAEFGSDKSAAYVREGRNILHLEQWQGHELTATTGRFIQLGHEYEKQLKGDECLYFFIDRIGVGAGVASSLRGYVDDHDLERWVIVGVQAGESSPDAKCHRLKDALWWRERAWWQDQAPAFSPAIARELRDQLISELASLTYTITEAGLIRVESKKQLKARGVASPNLADAAVLTRHWEAMKPDPGPVTWVEQMDAAGEQDSGWQ